MFISARPSPPEDFLVEEIGSRFIRLRWSLGPQTSSSAPVTYFILQFKKSSSLSWLEGWNTTVQAPSIHAVLEPLNPVTNYDIRVFSSNEIGHSFPSEPIAVLTLPEGLIFLLLLQQNLSDRSESQLFYWGNFFL